MQMFSWQFNNDWKDAFSVYAFHDSRCDFPSGCGFHHDRSDFCSGYGIHRNYYYDGADARNGVACVGSGSDGDGAGDKESSPMR
jgi:hypothetical protein